MQDVIDFLREEVEKCQQIAKVAEPDMAPSWLQSAELFERAADFIEARQKGTRKRNHRGCKWNRECHHGGRLGSGTGPGFTGPKS